MPRESDPEGEDPNKHLSSEPVQDEDEENDPSRR